MLLRKKKKYSDEWEWFLNAHQSFVSIVINVCMKKYIILTQNIKFCLFYCSRVYWMSISRTRTTNIVAMICMDFIMISGFTTILIWLLFRIKRYNYSAPFTFNWKHPNIDFKFSWAAIYSNVIVKRNEMLLLFRTPFLLVYCCVKSHISLLLSCILSYFHFCLVPASVHENEKVI